MAGPVKEFSDEEVFSPQKEFSDEEVFSKAPGQIGALSKKASASVKSTLAQKDPDVNYSGIPDVLAQASYSLIPKPEDKTAYLQQRYGKDNVTKDSFGRDVIIKDGEKIAFKSREPGTRETFGQDISTHAGDVLPVGGMVAGGIAGAPAGGVGSILGSGAGAMGGEAINQVIANLLGLPNTQTMGERANDILTRGAEGAAAETLGQGAMFAGRSMLGPYRASEGNVGRSIFGPYGEGSRAEYLRQMAELKAAQENLPGIRPKVGTFAPNAPLVQRLQSAGNRVFGDEGALLNRPILEKKAEELATQAGQGKVGEAVEPQVSNALSRRADLTVERANYNADIAMKDATAALKEAQDSLTKSVGEPTGKVAGMANEAIQASRKAFGDKASELYAPVDAMVGKPVVPTQPLKDMLKSIIETMPPTKGGQVSVLVPEKLQTFAKGVNELPDYITFQQMQAARSKFGSASDVQALDAGLSERQAGLLKKAADASFDAAASKFASKPIYTIESLQKDFANNTVPLDVQRAINSINASGRNVRNMSPEQLVEEVNKASGGADVFNAERALRKADMFYAAGMKRFDDLSVQALVKDAGEHGYIQPEKVARFIATPGQTDKLLRIKKVIDPETFQQIGAERWKQMVSDSEDLLTGQVDGRKLSKQLNDMGPSLDALYGSKANEMRDLARQWAVLGGKAEEVSSPASIRKALEAQVKSNEIQSKSWMMNIGKSGPESLRAADYLTDPKNRFVFNQARQTFGEKAPEIAATKEYLARKIFSSMEQSATKGAEKYGKTELMGQPLVAELNRYGRPYLEDVFGKEWTDNAFNFAKAAEIATRKNPSDAGAIVVAAYALKPFSHVGGLIKMFGAQEILSSPAAIQYMTRGIEGGAVDFMRTMGALTTRGVSGYEAVNSPRNAADYSRAAREKMRNQFMNQSLPGMTGGRG